MAKKDYESEMKKKDNESEMKGTFVMANDLLLWKYNDARLALVYGKIWSLSRNKKMVCYASRGLLARQLGMNLSTIDAKKALLKKEGYIIDLASNQISGVRYIRPTKKLQNEILDFEEFLKSREDMEVVDPEDLSPEDLSLEDIEEMINFKDKSLIFREYLQHKVNAQSTAIGIPSPVIENPSSSEGNSDIVEGRIPHKYTSNIDNNKEDNSFKTHDSVSSSSYEAEHTSHELDGLKEPSPSIEQNLSRQEEELLDKELLDQESVRKQLDSLFSINEENSEEENIPPDNSTRKIRSLPNLTRLSPDCDEDLEILQHFGVDKFTDNYQKKCFHEASKSYFFYFENYRPKLDEFKNLEEFIQRFYSSSYKDRCENEQ